MHWWAVWSGALDQPWDIWETVWPRDVVRAVEGFADASEFVWLDGGGCESRRNDARYSLIATRPLAVLTQCDQQPARLSVAGRTMREDGDGWQLWREAHKILPRLDAAPWPVAPGWVGYVGFEMARFLERLPGSQRTDLEVPHLRLALVDRAIVLDHDERRAFAVRAARVAESLEITGDSTESDADWIERWESAARGLPRVAPPLPPPVRLTTGTSREAYEDAVRRALAYIGAGDVYQVNLARRVQIGGVGAPLATYASLRRANPAPYSALLRWDDRAIASVSPELFLQLRGDEVLTRPIKGTRPRTGDVERDKEHRQALLDSAKEAAELAMIVDLHRNDLGRVCRYGSVCVARARCIEAHPTVFHTVADVVGRLRSECDAIDLLAACFPAGSISGVPKIRAIEIIDELEPVARGAYTGAVGVVALDGQMTMNVAIRTLQMRGAEATLYVGGGIVADSDPAAEYAETLAKARGILRGLGVVGDVGGETRRDRCVIGSA